MRTFIVFILITCVTFNKVCAQKLQIGFGAGINNTIFHKSASVYEDEYFITKPVPRVAFSLPVIIKLNATNRLITGLGLQVKEYKFVQNKFGTTDLKGHIYFSTRFTTLEVPLLYSSRLKIQKNYMFMYSFGCVLSLNMPKQNGYGYGFESGRGSFVLIFDTPEPKWEKTISPDLYAGISIGKFDEQRQKHSFTLSYQYGLIPTTRFDFSSHIILNNTHFSNFVMLRPILSTLMLTYSFFPSWLCFGKA